ncbi:CPBP family intramembrane glutamic endopeptidase [Brevundimonas sp. Root1423]|uniref:CPBP family intramembrane glutamic endopeptidase n=1 Tax=Brevundimonas sp. Root1423 TaxID=1736462 RepID=UPI0006F2D753|nr:CPBP family intramembrane glutamic endopeptidase [Brevundimonas sp. Root1423]KQY96436.1 hypothetical protein ASD25_00670 [Brevundimonas sp. Root1423]
MVQSRRVQIDLALAAAAQSPLTTQFAVERPWLRLGGFALMAILLVGLWTFVLALVLVPFPDLRDQVGSSTPLPDTAFRLVGESLQTLVFAAAISVVALGILQAAAMTYRRPMKDFLWPGRRFDKAQLGIGFLAMACMSVITIPIYLATGSEWAPPILDGQYLDRTRFIYVLAMVAGLFVAAAAEEVMFRGVMLRLTGLITRRPLLLYLINGLVFSAIHLDPDPIAFIARALSGTVWTWAALRLGGLEFAIGAHLANNLIISLFWQPFSEAAIARESEWIDLGPEVLTAVAMIVMIERLARRYIDLPSDLAARPAA